MSGHWAETSQRPQSIASTVTVSPSNIPTGSTSSLVFASVDSDAEGDTSASDSEFSDVPGHSVRSNSRKESLDKLLQGSNQKNAEQRNPGVPETSEPAPKEPRARAKVKRKPRSTGMDAVIVLKEEKVMTPFEYNYLRQLTLSCRLAHFTIS